MNCRDSIRLLATILLVAAVYAAPAAETAPEDDGRRALASVNGEPITLEDLLRHIDTFHESVMEPQAQIQAPDPAAVLERIINARLVLQEARNIGLDELPEVVAKLRESRMDLIRRTLVEHHLAGVTEGDPDEIERLYRDAVREVRIESVLFTTPQAASEFQDALAAGRDFEQVAGAMIASGEAEAVEQAAYVKASELHPDVTAVVLTLEPGAASAPIEVADGSAVVRLLDVRYPESAEARAEAQEKALQLRQQVALVEYTDKLRGYAEIEDEIVDGLDYHAEEPGLEALRNDARVVAEIDGGEPITVGELTRRIENRFFHGMDDAIRNERVNEVVLGVLDRIVLERAAVLEIERLGIDRTPEYRNAWTVQEENLLFRTFVAKVVDPEIKLEEEELQAYYDENPAEFTSAGEVRLQILAFHERADAEAASAKLRAGADVDWMRTHADGQVDAESGGPLMALQGKRLPVSAFPEDVRAAVAGVSRGDVRFLARSDGPYYVFLVTEVTAPKKVAYDQVREQIANLLYLRKRQRAIEEWTAQLRNASDIEVLVDGGELKALVGLGAREET